MSGDFPHGATTSKRQATAFVNRMNKDDAAEAARDLRGRVYWKAREFELGVLK